jgi:hypothetical protein
MFICVDLASKFSAVAVFEGGKVIAEFDSGDLSAFEFIDRLIDHVDLYRPTRIIVEDVPYGISNQSMVKPVLRLQGILIHALGQVGYLDKTVFVNPRVWQSMYDGVARGAEKDRIEAARVAALNLGYTPPDLIGNYVATLPEGAKVLKKHTNPLAKQMTDYIDAFLISHWTSTFDSLDSMCASAKGVQRVYL